MHFIAATRKKPAQTIDKKKKSGENLKKETTFRRKTFWEMLEENVHMQL